MTTPWVCYGQTLLPAAAGVSNPAPNVNGLIGEVDELPYIVPVGKVLVLKSMGMEPMYGGAVLPWIGDDPIDKSKCLMTTAGWPSKLQNTTPGAVATSSILLTGFDYYIPAGKKLNVYLSTNPEAGGSWVYAWYLGGELIDAI